MNVIERMLTSPSRLRLRGSCTVLPGAIAQAPQIGKCELDVGVAAVLELLKRENAWREFAESELCTYFDIVETLTSYGWIVQTKGSPCGPGMDFDSDARFEVTEGFVYRCIGLGRGLMVDDEPTPA